MPDPVARAADRADHRRAGRRAVRPGPPVGSLRRRRRAGRAQPAHARAHPAGRRAGRRRHRGVVRTRPGGAPGVDNPIPALHHMTVGGDVCGTFGPDALQASADFVGVAFHGMAVSHIDALCHVFVDGQMYNGYPASAVTTPRRPPRRHRRRLRRPGGPRRADRPRPPPRRRLARARRGRGPRRARRGAGPRQGVATEPGDILLVHTGRDRAAPRSDRGSRTGAAWPGSTPSACRGSSRPTRPCSAPTA